MKMFRKILPVLLIALLLYISSSYVLDNIQANKQINQLTPNIIESITLQEFEFNKESGLDSKLVIKDKEIILKVVDRIKKFDGKISYNTTTERVDGFNEKYGLHKNYEN